VTRPAFVPGQLRRTRVRDHLVRALFGGGIAVVTGALARWSSPELAGLFLAFPAILPASITLIKEVDGRAAAVDDARGAILGGFGLTAFALVVAFTAGKLPDALVIVLASAAWLAVAVGAWLARYGRS
jgi:hypothetical protein